MSSRQLNWFQLLLGSWSDLGIFFASLLSLLKEMLSLYGLLWLGGGLVNLVSFRHFLNVF